MTSLGSTYPDLTVVKRTKILYNLSLKDTVEALESI